MSEKSPAGVVKAEILEKIVDNVIKGDGKLRGRSGKDRKEVMRTLSEHLKGFRKGSFSTIYVPLSYPLDGFENHLKPLLENCKYPPEEVYLKLTTLLKELQSLKTPFRTKAYGSIIEKVDKARPSHGEKVYNFVDRYMTINRKTLVDIVRILNEHGSVSGCISAIESSFQEQGYEDMHYLLDLRMGDHKDDTLRKRLYAIARLYDGLLVMLGAAYHYDRGRRLRKRYSSYVLMQSPFSQAFIDLVLGSVSAEDYIKAFRSFIEHAIRLSTDPLEYAVSRCGEQLAEWRKIGVEVEPYLIRGALQTIRATVDEISKGLAY
jgi:hypothetical protein